MTMLQTISRSYKAIIRAIAGHEYRTIHIDSKGNRKWFHSATLEDALEWASCALNEDQVQIICRNGYLVAERRAIKV